jgi:SAM-dependent methyltransferase
VDYHDVLAELGVANAHPGGNRSTLIWMAHVPLDPSTKVLDVGCGTGHTACSLVRSTNCMVTAIDIRPKMVSRARERAKLMDVSIKAQVASAERLPFPDQLFDVIITESVNVFVQPTKALGEYFRVLKPGGTYIDVEMMTLLPVNDEWYTSVKQVYGVKHVPDLRSWKSFYLKSGFTDIQVLESRSMQPMEHTETNDDLTGASVASKKALNDPRVIQVIQENATWLERNYHTLGFCIFKCRKPSDSIHYGNQHISPLPFG